MPGALLRASFGQVHRFCFRPNNEDEFGGAVDEEEADSSSENGLNKGMLRYEVRCRGRRRVAAWEGGRGRVL